MRQPRRKNPRQSRLAAHILRQRRLHKPRRRPRPRRTSPAASAQQNNETSPASTPDSPAAQRSTSIPGSAVRSAACFSQPRQPPKDHRLPRLHPHPGKEKLRAKLRQHLLHQVVLARRNPARKQQQIRTSVPPQSAPAHPPACPAQSPAVAPPTRRLHQRRQRVTVRVANLLRLRRLVQLHQLIAGRHNRHHRPLRAPPAPRARKPPPAQSPPRPSPSPQPAAPRPAAPRCPAAQYSLPPQAPPRRGPHLAAALLRVLDHRHRIRTRRHRGSSHDLDRASPLAIAPPAHASPARTCPTTRSLCPPTTPSARTANPSRVARSNGG